MSNRRLKKPIGQTGKIRTTHSKGDPIITWEPIDFPADKQAQELVIASAFVKQLNSNIGTCWTVQQLGENNFDFLLRSATDSRYLELQEIVIPSPKKGIPYASRDQVVQSKKFSETIISEIRKKAIKYPKATTYVLDLLVYVTHWRFMTSNTVRKMVAHYLKHNAHPFAHVYEFSIFDEASGAIQVLFPSDEWLGSFHRHAAVAHRYVNIDPATHRSIKNADGSIGVGFNIVPETFAKLRRAR
jgi:hypothetical protein